MTPKRFDIDTKRKELDPKYGHLGGFLYVMQTAAIKGDERLMREASNGAWKFTEREDIGRISQEIERIWGIYRHRKEGPRWEGNLRWS